MTDNEIIKALEKEIHLVKYIDGYYADNVSIELLQNSIDLINLQKAEIERLNIVKKEYQELYDELKTENEKLKTSIKEVNEHLSEGDFVNGIALIIRLVKEMVGDTGMTYEESLNQFNSTNPFMHGSDKQKEYFNMIRQALEKQIPMKPMIKKDGYMSISYDCPYCEQYLVSEIDGELCAGRKYKYCFNCGQALDWGT